MKTPTPKQFENAKAVLVRMLELQSKGGPVWFRAEARWFRIPKYIRQAVCMDQDVNIHNPDGLTGPRAVEENERLRHQAGIIDSQVRAAIGNHPELWNREDHRYDTVRSAMWNALSVIQWQAEQLREVK